MVNGGSCNKLITDKYLINIAIREEDMVIYCVEHNKKIYKF